MEGVTQGSRVEGRQREVGLGSCYIQETSQTFLQIFKLHKYIFPIYVYFHFTAPTVDCTVFMRVSHMERRQ